MAWLRGLWERVREALDRRGFEDELDEELRFHLDQEVERLTKAGMALARARLQAERNLGGIDRTKEETREGAGFPWLDMTLRDSRHALRGLRRRPSFAAATIGTLALGIGATTAIFSVVNGVLLEPLPYPDPDRLVRLVEQNSPTNRWNISMADFLGVEEQQKVFESVAAFSTGTAAFTGHGTPEQIDVVRVTADWFRVLGVKPAVGRGFRSGEDRPGAASVVVLSSAFRDRVFGPGADAVGATVTLNDAPHTVVGVLSPDQETLAGRKADAWPILKVATPKRRGPFLFGGIARLKVGRTLDDARADLAGISRRIFPIWSSTGFGDENAMITPYSLKKLMLGDVAGGLWLMLGAVVGVLLIAVANVGNLFLVRAAGRESELRVRTALGASGRRLVGQLLAESMVVASLGGIAGVGLAWIGVRTLVAAAPTLPRIDEVTLDGRVLVVTAIVTVISAVLFGLAPLARVVFTPLEAPDRARGAIAARGGWSRIRAALVTAEFAVAFGVSMGAGLLIGSFVRLQRVDPGYEPRDVVTMHLALPQARYSTYEADQLFWDETQRRLEEAAEIRDVGIGTAVPPAGSAGTNDFDLLDRPVAPGESEPVALWNWVSPGFFRALGVPLLSGRFFGERDRAAAEGAPVVVVSASWARRFYPDGGAVGARLYSGGDRSVAMTVVGVVGDVKYTGLDATDEAVVYEPRWQRPLSDAFLVVRGRADTRTVLERVRRELAAVDPAIPLADVRTMDERTADSLARPRYWTALMGLFASLGLVLAGVGVYGVLSYYVSNQRKELAIRMSLGARPSTVRRLVLGRGLRLAAIGIVFGVGLSLTIAQWLRALLFGVSPEDPATLAIVALGLAAVAITACAVPARSAARLEPMSILKGE